MAVWQERGHLQLHRRLSQRKPGRAQARSELIAESPCRHRNRRRRKVQVDYGDGPMVRDPNTGNYRRVRMVVRLWTAPANNVHPPENSPPSLNDERYQFASAGQLLFEAWRPLLAFMHVCQVFDTEKCDTMIRMSTWLDLRNSCPGFCDEARVLGFCHES
jgi:hypothetical protein